MASDETSEISSPTTWGQEVLEGWGDIWGYLLGSMIQRWPRGVSQLLNVP